MLDSVRPFYALGIIEDILAQVKGGKEASVYRCRAQADFIAANGLESSLLAAKVYRPRQFRNLRNDAMYREGRGVLSGAGHMVKQNEHRVMRALGKKTSFGAKVGGGSELGLHF
ncbi:hypothetical protein KFU94_48600 [Chloroflexi bacterium TSY]|nr:hypothetical protein [Chloroflexi bacterium TSY]